jgi:hypothetical protein
VTVVLAFLIITLNSYFILNLLINANDLSLKFIIIDLWDRKVDEYIFDLIFQIIIEDVISDHFKLLNLID